MQMRGSKRALALIAGVIFIAAVAVLCARPVDVFADSWGEDKANFHWTQTGTEAPKWSGGKSTQASGDPKTNAMTIPQQSVAASFSYKAMTVANGGALAMPSEKAETVSFYEIYYPEQLRYAMEQQLPIKLMRDLDLQGNAGKSWTNVSFSKKMLIDGNGHTIYNLKSSGGLIGSWSQELIIHDLHVVSAQMTDALIGGSNANTYLSLEKVSLEQAINEVASGFGGGLVKNAYYRSTGSFARLYADQCHTKNVYVNAASCSGNLFGPISGYVKNSYAIDGTMRTVAHSGAFTSCAGNYIFENCYTNVRAYDSARGNTGAFVGHPEDSKFAPGGDGVSKFINCYAAGFVEGTTNLGGFAGGIGDSEKNGTKYSFQNCYSTAMVGMKNGGTNQGGFIGNIEGAPLINVSLENCYAAGEVGTLGSIPGQQNMAGFIGYGTSGKYTMKNCYYDKQTSAMKEIGINGGASTGLTGLLTKELMSTLPDKKSPADSAWVLSDGTYPQLKAFAANEQYSGADKQIADSYSKASVCTAMLYPSNLEGEAFEKAKSDYDTVRSIRFLFPLTNNRLAGTEGVYDISWQAGDEKSTVPGMTNAQIVTLNGRDPDDPASDYSVASLAPGVGWVTAYAEKDFVKGQRQLRLVPTSAITMAKDDTSKATTGTNAVIYAVPEHETVTESDAIDYLDWKSVTYDHRAGVTFAKGDEKGQNIVTDKMDGIEAKKSLDSFNLTNAKGTVQVKISKKNDEGKFEPAAAVSDDLIKLLTGQRAALIEDLGEYRITYRWYANESMAGSDTGYMESSKTLKVIEAVTAVYYRNYNKTDNTILALPDGSIPTGQDKLYYKNDDKLQKLPADPSERKGYSFQGWSRDRDSFGEGSQYKITKDTEMKTSWADSDKRVQVYAIWSANKHNIIIGNPDGTVAEHPQTIETHFGANVADEVKDKEPAKEGFIGWTTEKGSGKANVTSEMLMGDGDLTVYPVYLPDPGIEKSVINNTHSDTTVVDDKLTYTITIKNEQENSVWKDVTIRDRIPPGLTLDTHSIVLTKPDLQTEKLPESVYDKKTQTISYPLGEVKGGETYILTFDVTVNAQAVGEKKDDSQDITNKAEASGTDQNGNPADQESDGVLPDGGDQVRPLDPAGSITKSGKNLTDSSGVTQVGDKVKYTIVAENKRAGSLLRDVVIRDTLPEGLTLDAGSIVLTTPANKQIKVDAGAYDKKSRILSVYVGNVWGGQRYTLTFTATVNEDAIGKDIGNIASFIGGKPSDQTGSDGNPNPGNPPYDPGNPPYDPGDSPYHPGDGYLPGTGDKLPDGSTPSVKMEIDELVYPNVQDSKEPEVLPGDPEPVLDKSVVNNTHPSGSTHMEDLLTYRVALTNPKAGTLWKNVWIFDYLPQGLTLDKESLKLIAPNGSVRKLSAAVYDKQTRVIQVPIAELKGGETYTLIYKARVTVDDNGDGASPGPIVNHASAKGDNPDGSKSRITPKASASVPYPVDAPVQTGDNGLEGIQLLIVLALLSLGVMLAVWRKRRS